MAETERLINALDILIKDANGQLELADTLYADEVDESYQPWLQGWAADACQILSHGYMPAALLEEFNAAIPDKSAESGRRAVAILERVRANLSKENPQSPPVK
jgi:hypothetical protein